MSKPKDRAARAVGSELRASKPPDWLSDWKRPAGRDARGTLDRAAEGRDRDLVERRNKEMGSDAPTFLRGAAGVMARDLAETLADTTGIQLEICGDAHLGNFGMYGSPERKRVFDLTDFDEARPGPWEWDVCRLATSVVVTARDRGVDTQSEKLAAAETVGAYCDTINKLASGSLLGRWYALARCGSVKRRDLAAADEGSASADVVARAQRLLDGAADRTQANAVDELTAGGEFTDDGGDQTPLRGHDPRAQSVQLAYGAYVLTLPEALRRLLQGYQPTAVAERPVGEGSLGLRNYLLLLQGPEATDALVVQVKEATPSQLSFGLEPYPTVHEGERVVRMQRTLQAVSDPLLGWTSIDGQAFYVRQFHDRKGAPKLEMDKKQGTADYASDLAAFGRLCGVTLARAHARAADDADGQLLQISAYLGAERRDHKAFQDAVLRFARSYAQVTEDDCKTLDNASAAIH
jgi:uncharacterized protein (DUF2252 family)